MYRTTLKRFYTLIFSIVSTSFLVGLTIFVIKYVAEQRQTMFAQELLQTARTVADETSNKLQDLNTTLGEGACSEAKIQSMRQQLFTSRHVKEIAFYQSNKEVCNTSIGLLREPTELDITKTVLTADNELVLAHSVAVFENDYPVVLVKSDNFHVMLSPDEAVHLERPLFLWQWVYKDTENLIEMSGVKGLFRQLHNSPQTLDTMSVVVCENSSGFCVATADKLIKQFDRTTIAMIIAGILVAVVVFYYLAHILITHYYCHELRIKRGIKNKLFYPVFQPIIDLQSGDIVGCEVLARFKDKLGHLSPDEFIPVVFKSNLTIPFTRGIFKAAMSALVHQNGLPESFKVNFNIFPNDLTVTNYARLNENKEFFASRFQLCFEITEDEPFKSASARAALKKIKEINVEVAIDDFGTGYSNLSQLQSIPLDYLKLDKSFCVGLEKNAFRAGLIPQIVKIADSLDVPVVAEGVETDAQRNILLREGVKFAQGFFFSRPISAPKLNSLMVAQATAN